MLFLDSKGKSINEKIQWEMNRLWNTLQELLPGDLRGPYPATYVFWHLQKYYGISEILWFLLKDHLAAKCFLHVFSGCLSHRFYSANAHKTKFIFDLLPKTSFLIHNCSQQHL